MKLYRNLIRIQMDYLAEWRGCYYLIAAAQGDGMQVMLKPLNIDRDWRAIRREWKSRLLNTYILIKPEVTVDLYNPHTREWDRYEAQN